MKLVFQVYKGILLRLLLVESFVLQIFAAVNVTDYLIFRNSRQAIADLANVLNSKNSLIQSEGAFTNSGTFSEGAKF
ncbi:hypothetical protein IQ238_14360 [Pleurocapsales cyanobacterium LEGE 06147]|nr:hypothetical protein [Pleurocapsales cyanobacterium LEGE 06147]